MRNLNGTVTGQALIVVASLFVLSAMVAKPGMAQSCGGFPPLMIAGVPGTADAMFWAHAPGVSASFSRRQVEFQATRLPADLDPTATALVLRPRGCGHASPRGEVRSPTHVNWYLGQDPSTWRTDLSAFERVAYGAAGSGITLDWRITRGVFQYTIIVEPGADESVFAFQAPPVGRFLPKADGSVDLDLGASTWTQTAPRAWEIGELGAQIDVDCKFRVDPDGSLGFDVQRRDRSRRLVIDPFVVVTTRLTAQTAADGLLDVTTDPAGNVLATGGISTTTINSDAFVLRRSPDLATAQFLTVIGGTLAETPNRVVVAPSGDIYVCGNTTSTNFPTPGGYRTTQGGAGDAFISRLTPLGTMINGTYLGGSAADYGTLATGGGGFQVNGGLAVDKAGLVYITGQTASFNFPTTPGAAFTIRSGASDGFVSKLSANLGQLVASTYYGGTSDETPKDCTIDPWGDILTYSSTTSSTGVPLTSNALSTSLQGTSDDLLVRFDPTLTRVLYASYVGGNGTEFAARVRNGPRGSVYVAGVTTSTNLATPGAISSATTAAGQDCYVARLTIGVAATSLDWAAVLGGGLTDFTNGLAVDEVGNAYVCGATTSTNYPVLAGTSYSGGTATGPGDGFISCLSANGTTLLASSYLGGTGDDAGNSVVLGRSSGQLGVDDVYFAGYTTALPFPGATGAIGGGSDGFIAALQFQAGPPRVLTVSPATSGLAGVPVTITGGGFLGQGTTTVRFGGVPATSVVVTNATTITCVAPAASASGAVDVDVQNNAGTFVLNRAFTYTVTNVTPFGCPTPQMTTAPQLGAGFPPVQGAPFSFVCRAAQPNVVGFIVVTSARYTAPLMVGAVPVWVDLSIALPIIPLTSDGAGTSILAFTMPSGPGLSGLSLYAQAAWPDAASAAFAVTEAIQLTIQ